MTGGKPARTADVDLAGVQILGLRVTDGGDGSSYDHADWADAVIITADAVATALPPFRGL